MSTYRITNQVSGHCLGTFDGADADAAVAAMHRDAGHTPSDDDAAARAELLVEAVEPVETVVASLEMTIALRDRVSTMLMQAGQAGDDDTVELCRAAIAGDKGALSELFGEPVETVVVSAYTDGGRLVRHRDGVTLRDATADEIAESNAAAELDGGRGLIRATVTIELDAVDAVDAVDTGAVEVVLGAHGPVAQQRRVEFAAAVALMDGEICEVLHADGTPRTEQSFLDAYADLHARKYGAPFAC